MENRFFENMPPLSEQGRWIDIDDLAFDHYHKYVLGGVMSDLQFDIHLSIAVDQMLKDILEEGEEGE